MTRGEGDERDGDESDGVGDVRRDVERSRGASRVRHGRGRCDDDDDDDGDDDSSQGVAQ